MIETSPKPDPHHLQSNLARSCRPLNLSKGTSASTWQALRTVATSISQHVLREMEVFNLKSNTQCTTYSTLNKDSLTPNASSVLENARTSSSCRIAQHMLSITMTTISPHLRKPMETQLSIVGMVSIPSSIVSYWGQQRITLRFRISQHWSFSVATVKRSSLKKSQKEARLQLPPLAEISNSSSSLT